jgi:hypothetical protein
MKCPNCNKDLPDYAMKCKYCDTKLTTTMTTQEKDAEYQREKKRGNSCLIYTFIAAALIIIIAYFALQPRDSSNPSAAPSFPAHTQTSKYSSPLAKVWTGVKVYYGSGSEKTYAFEVLGGSSDCPSMPSGKGVKVKYSNGTEEWKDSDAIVLSGTFYVLSDDPAIKKMEWYVYKSCP